MPSIFKINAAGCDQHRDTLNNFYSILIFNRHSSIININNCCYQTHFIILFILVQKLWETQLIRILLHLQRHCTSSIFRFFSAYGQGQTNHSHPYFIVKVSWGLQTHLLVTEGHCGHHLLSPLFWLYSSYSLGTLLLDLDRLDFCSYYERMPFFQWTWYKTCRLFFRRFIADTLDKAMRSVAYVSLQCRRQRLLGNRSSICHLDQFVGGPVIIQTNSTSTSSCALKTSLHYQQCRLIASNGRTQVPWLDFQSGCPPPIPCRG